MMEDYKLEDDGFPPVECLVDFFLEGKWDFTVAPALISGVLRQGHKMLLAGPSKAGKSFALIELALCLASGKPWLGRFECTAGKVMYVNLEVDPKRLESAFCQSLRRADAQARCSCSFNAC